VTGIVQLAAAARLVPQLITPVLNSLAPAPVIEIELILRAEVPVLLNVTFCAVLVVPAGCVANVNDVGVNLTAAVLGLTVRVAF
jgi:hypothetical protein